MYQDTGKCSRMETLLKALVSLLMQAAGCTSQESNESEADLTDYEIALAVISENLEAINRYLQKPANIDRLIMVRGQPVTPLHLACQFDKLSLVRLLIQANANIDIQAGQHGSSPLHFAAHFGHQAVVDLLINAQVQIDLQDPDGYSALYIASNLGHDNVVDSLIRAQADVDIRNNTGESSLYIASNFGHKKVVDLLLKAQAKVDVQEVINGSTALYMASQNGHQLVVDSLIQAQADVDLTENDGCSPLYIASQNGHHQVVRSLIKAKADVDLAEKASGSTPLYVASQDGRHRVVEMLLKAHANVNYVLPRDGSSPLYSASRYGHQAVVNLLINARCDVNIQTHSGESPLYVASQNCHCKVVDSLIKAKADVDLPASKGSSPLHVAALAGNQQIVESLINADANVNQQTNNGESPLHIAGQEGHKRVAEALIEAKADINLQRKSGESPLFMASQNGHQAVVELLIKSKAETNLRDNRGQTSLYIAAHFGHHQIVESLIKAQADVNLPNRTGESPLYIASHFGHHKVVHSFIHAQADLNLQNKDGEAPLFVASLHGHKDAVDALIQAQADVNLCDKQGCSPLYIASQDGHHGIVKLLIKAQADVNSRTHSGSTPLYIAAQNGHQLVVDTLIEAQADVNLRTNNGLSPLLIASQNGHLQVVASLMKAQGGFNEDILTAVSLASQFGHRRIVDLLSQAQGLAPGLSGLESRLESTSFTAQPSILPIPSDQELSQQLHSALSSSGFTASRAALQMAVADVLQEILGQRINAPNVVFVVGSFSEGWGNNLKTLDGRTDIESDIDVMTLFQGQLYHQRGWCQCSEAKILHEYSNGHILCPGFTSNPARPSFDSPLRPAVDQVPASRLCRYPPLGPFQPQRASESHISKSVLKSLHRDVTSNSATPCHVVLAASPGRGGHELRVSTSFLEKRMLRSLTTLQGQLFVTLKYLVKKVIAHKDGFNVQGVKPYHIKTITFRMLEKTPAGEWTNPKNLVSLTRRSLQMLLDSVESSRTPDNVHGRVMEHFFLTDAALYLKGVNQSDSDQILSNIARTLRAVMDRLPQLLQQFISGLKPVSESGRFYFHPFQILPDIRPRALPPSSREIEYHEIYDVVRECVLRLSHQDCSVQSQESLARLISRLPDCALTTREALRALACLKFGYENTAERIISQCRGHRVSPGIDWTGKTWAAEATVESIWRHLRSQDSAYKFCFCFDQRPEFQSALGALVECFPLPLGNYNNCFFINFDALMWALRLQLHTESDFTASSWLSEVAERDDADLLELLVAILFTFDFDTVEILIGKVHQLKAVVPDWLRVELKRRWPRQI